jgi:hypothetical protein
VIVHCCVHKRNPPIPLVLRQQDSVHKVAVYYYNSHFNSTLQFAAKSPKSCFLQVFPLEFCTNFSAVTCILHGAPIPSSSIRCPWYYLVNIVSTHYATSSTLFFLTLPWCKYSSQYPVLYIEKQCAFFTGTEKLVNTDSSQSNIKNISIFLHRTRKDETF